jgi:hypothetical protein
MLEQIAKYVEEIEPKLPTMVADSTRFAIIGDSDGDACLFNGLLSTVALRGSVKWNLIAVGMSQGENGMFYRSPYRRVINNEGYSSFFSRDMALGVLCAATDTGFPLQWWSLWNDYIEKSRPCLKKKSKALGGGCWIRSPIFEYAPDDRAKITPIMWAMMKRVSDFRGFKLRGEMKKWEGYDGDACVLQAENCKEGFALHLEAVGAYIKYLTGQSREYSQKIANICYRRVPDNLFYQYLAERSVTQDLMKKFLDMAPSPNSTWGNSWVWEKSSASKELSTSCGWDFVFLGKLILKNIL